MIGEDKTYLSTMPRHVRVGPISYSVRLAEIRDDGMVTYGDVEIVISSRLCDVAQRQTLWHEVIHVILTQGGFNRHDERMTEVLANGVMQVLQDNPWFREDKFDDQIKDGSAA